MAAATLQQISLRPVRTKRCHLHRQGSSSSSYNNSIVGSNNNNNYNSDCSRISEECESTDVVAYEPVRTSSTSSAYSRNNNVRTGLLHLRRRRPDAPSRLRFFKTRLTFSFSVYMVTGGTLLTVGTFLLSGVLLLLGLIALGFSAFIAITWFFFSKAYGMANNVSQRFLNVRPARAAVASATNASNRHLQHVD